MEKIPKTGLVWLLEIIKEYQRPVRTCLWTILISVAFILCLAGKIPCVTNFMTESILIGMFTDMGIYTAARSLEKHRKYKIESEHQDLQQK